MGRKENHHVGAIVIAVSITGFFCVSPALVHAANPTNNTKDLAISSTAVSKSPVISEDSGNDTGDGIDEMTNTTGIFIEVQASSIGIPVYRSRVIVQKKNSIDAIEQYNGSSIPTSEPQILTLCGYPVFEDEQKCPQNVTISSCMDYEKAIAFGATTGIFGALIIGTNVLIAILIFINKSFRTHHYFIKASLAVADSIVGFLLLFVVTPNIAWVANISTKSLTYFPQEDINSPKAITVGSILTVSTTASLFHLLFLSVERFTAITWPFWYMRRKTSSVVGEISVLWAAAILISFVPAAFPDYFAYQFQPTLLIHMMTLQPVNGSNFAWRGPLYGTVTLIIPYMIMVGFCVVTAIICFRKIKKSENALGKKKESSSHCTRGNDSVKKNKDGRTKQEISVFITIGIMIVTFTVTLVPFTVVMILFMTGYLNCENYALPYVICFLLGLLNSLANGIIYGIRDKKIRNAAKSVFCRSKATGGRYTVATESYTVQTTRH